MKYYIVIVQNIDKYEDYITSTQIPAFSINYTWHFDVCLCLVTENIYISIKNK